MSPFTIRQETRNDHEAVRRVIVDAFIESRFGYGGEADLVDLLRKNCDNLVSLIATAGKDIVGQILFSPVSIRNSHGVTWGKGLAPMAIATHSQNVGIGTALVKSGLEQLSSVGCPFVVVLGHPDYYPRFGFQPGSLHGVVHGFSGIPQDVFFINILDPTCLPSIANGLAIYRAEFGPQFDGTEPSVR